MSVAVTVSRSWSSVPRALRGARCLVPAQLRSCAQHLDFYCTHTDFCTSVLDPFVPLTELCLS